MLLWLFLKPLSVVIHNELFISEMSKYLGFASDYSRVKRVMGIRGEIYKNYFFNVGNCEDDGTFCSNNIFEKGYGHSQKVTVHSSLPDFEGTRLNSK